MTLWRVIYSCPDPNCEQDLEPDADGWWCPDCEHVVADAKLAEVTDADLDDPALD